MLFSAPLIKMLMDGQRHELNLIVTCTITFTRIANQLNKEPELYRIIPFRPGFRTVCVRNCLKAIQLESFFLVVNLHAFGRCGVRFFCCCGFGVHCGNGNFCSLVYYVNVAKITSFSNNL